MAMYGRHGESPLPIVAASTPGQCFDAAIEAVRIAVTYRTPVILLTDTLPRELLGAVADPRRRRAAARSTRASPPSPTATTSSCPTARREPRAAVGGARARPGSQHRIGGLEKEDGTGNISYDPTTTR